VLVDLPFVKNGEVIPADATHLCALWPGGGRASWLTPRSHFGKAQTEGSVELSPGKHTLTLQFANALHKSYGKGFSKELTITVLP